MHVLFDAVIICNLPERYKQQFGGKTIIHSLYEAKSTNRRHYVNRCRHGLTHCCTKSRGLPLAAVCYTTVIIIPVFTDVWSDCWRRQLLHCIAQISYKKLRILIKHCICTLEWKYSQLSNYSWYPSFRIMFTWHSREWNLKTDGVFRSHGVVSNLHSVLLWTLRRLSLLKYRGHNQRGRPLKRWVPRNTLLVSEEKEAYRGNSPVGTLVAFDRVGLLIDLPTLFSVLLY